MTHNIPRQKPGDKGRLFLVVIVSEMPEPTSWTTTVWKAPGCRTTIWTGCTSATSPAVLPEPLSNSPPCPPSPPVQSSPAAPHLLTADGKSHKTPAVTSSSTWDRIPKLCTPKALPRIPQWSQESQRLTGALNLPRLRIGCCSSIPPMACHPPVPSGTSPPARPFPQPTYIS